MLELMDAVKRFEQLTDVKIRCKTAKLHMGLNLKNQIVENVLGNIEGFKTEFVNDKKPFHIRYTSDTFKYKIDVYAEDIDV